MRKLNNIMVTGGAGFIGSNFIHYIFKNTDFNGRIINVDKLTYAGNLENLSNINDEYGDKRYFFEKCDISDYENMKSICKKYDIDSIVNFAAESHVDRSISGPKEFIFSNIIGTFSLLEVARALWKDNKDCLFHHISTDEVYGSLDNTGFFYEDTPYDPRSPYSASKASSDHLVKSYFHTYGLPVTISNCTNNYGPYQFPEKLIPLMILNIKDDIELPVYGDGKNIRDWLFVDDHNSAIWSIMRNGKTGDTYNIGGENEWENIKLIKVMCEKLSKKLNKDIEGLTKLITYVKDRPGHDRRYAINCDKIKTELNWKQSVDFDTGLDITIEWYLNNEDWIDNVRTGHYRKWIEKNYAQR